MKTDQFVSARISLESEIRDLELKVTAVQTELQKKRRQMDLLVALIGSESTEIPLPEVRDNENSVSSIPTSSTTPDKVTKCVAEILSDVDRPMNINEIHSEFIRRGFPIPGKGTSFNILVHISKDMKKGKKSRFLRTSRGTYALRTLKLRNPSAEALPGLDSGNNAITVREQEQRAGGDRE
jgi:hypothetical protein